ncbi:MAG: hypothetical protein EP301_08780, partial [Gammaproteobacteria bacterium]
MAALCCRPRSATCRAITQPWRPASPCPSVMPVRSSAAYRCWVWRPPPVAHCRATCAGCITSSGCFQRLLPVVTSSCRVLKSILRGFRGITMTDLYTSLEAAFEKGMALAHHAASQGDALALASNFGDRTFNELNGRTNQLLRFLRDRGIGAGDAIAVVSRNRPEFIEAFAATQRGGIRFTPVNFHLTGEEAGYVIDNCEAKAVIYDADLGTGVDAISHAKNCAVRLAIGGEIEDFENYESAIAGIDAGDIE